MDIEQVVMDINATVAKQDQHISELETEVRKLRHDLNNTRAALNMLTGLLKEKRNGETKSILPTLSGNRPQTDA